MASSEAYWSGSTLFAIKYVNLFKQLWSSKQFDWKLEVGVISQYIQHDKGKSVKKAVSVLQASYCVV